jgi:hypothetical protein
MRRTFAEKGHWSGHNAIDKRALLYAAVAIYLPNESLRLCGIYVRTLRHTQDPADSRSCISRCEVTLSSGFSSGPGVRWMSLSSLKRTARQHADHRAG